MRGLWSPAFALFLALLGASACGRSVGDDCRNNSECDPNGDRVCDLSQPDGYCVVDGCDARSCPEDSVCIAVFPQQFASHPCDPAMPNSCAADETCLDVGLCVRRVLERRVCLKSCSDNDDCRGEYECRLAGTQGTMAIVRNPSDRVRFCAAREPTTP